MKKIYLLKARQHNSEHYVGVVSARDLVKLATRVEVETEQEAQRPIKKKRLNEIAEFINNEGTISTSVVIGTSGDKIKVYKEDNSNELFYIEFPETEAEFEQYKNTIDIMDGQHRLFSFLPEYCRLAEPVDFEIAFQMYVTPTMKERRLIFKNTNEKQEKVTPNLLMWFRSRLHLLTGKEAAYHPVVELLSSENCSPLRGRIIMGAENITGGLKAQQIINILDKTDIQNICGEPLDEYKMLSLISEYLAGWEKAVGAKIADRDKRYPPFSKIAGLKFMLYMLPTFYRQAKNDKAKLTKEYVSNKINVLFSTDGFEPKDLFDPSSKLVENIGSNPFSDETTITKLAKDWSAKLENISSDDFDPLA